MAGISIRAIEGDDNINEALTSAMRCTVLTMAKRGLITGEVAETFLNENVCISVAADGPFVSWLKRNFDGTPTNKIVIANFGSNK